MNRLCSFASAYGHIKVGSILYGVFMRISPSLNIYKLETMYQTKLYGYTIGHKTKIRGSFFYFERKQLKRVL